MRRATGTLGVLAGLLAGLAGAPGAWAGTFEVASCGAPGAGGVNSAWLGRPTGFGSQPPQPEMYDIRDACASGSPELLVQSHVGDGDRGRAKFLTGAEWIVQAPQDARITKLVTWASGTRFRTNRDGDPEPNVPGDQGDPWSISANEANNNVVGGAFGEQCPPPGNPPGNQGCSFGDGAGMAGRPRTYALDTTSISYKVLCSSLSGCDRFFADVPTAAVRLYGTLVSITDDRAAELSAAGPLFSDGFKRGTESVTASASDNTGVKSVRIEVDGGVRKRDALGCDFRKVQPCPLSDRRTFPFAERPLSDGAHTVAVVAEDASGTETKVERRVVVDTTAPRLAVGAQQRRRVVVGVEDAVSGVDGGQIEVRNAPSEPFRPLPTTFEGGVLAADLDRGRASGVGLRVTARDKAGNTSVVEGDPSRLSATRAAVGRRSAAIRGGRVKARARQGVTIRGTLRGIDGRPLGGRQIVVTSALRRTGAGSEPVAVTTTAPDGTYAADVAPGPSRLVRLAFAGGDGFLPSARGVSLRVPASSSIAARPRSVRGGGRVSFSGRLSTSGQPVPRSGKLIDLQAYDRGRWRTFETTRARGSRATWRASYRFGQRPGRYRIRVRIRRESTFPFELGYSRPVVVRVR